MSETWLGRSKNKEMSGNFFRKNILYHFGKVVSDFLFPQKYFVENTLVPRQKIEEKFNFFYFFNVFSFLIFCHGMEQQVIGSIVFIFAITILGSFSNYKYSH